MQPIFLACECSSAGSRSSECSVDSGQCQCRPNYEGEKCDRCAAGFYGYPNCQPCECNGEGSQQSFCNPSNGQCSCRAIYTGRQCDKCLSGFYGFPNCKQCNCNPAGTRPDDGGSFGDCSTSKVVRLHLCYIKMLYKIKCYFI